LKVTALRTIAIGLGIQPAKMECIPLLKVRRGRTIAIKSRSGIPMPRLAWWERLEHRRANAVPRGPVGAYIKSIATKNPASCKLAGGFQTKKRLLAK
jgi:hypothetical protein